MSKETAVNNDFKFGEVEIIPSPRLIDSIRYSSHSFKTSFGDLTDNSLDSGASEIFILAGKRDGELHVTVADNGCGMDPYKLQEALCLGMKNSSEETQSQRLGRFGLGLKTAAGFIGEKLTIYTKVKGGELIKAEHFYKEIMEKGWIARILQSTSEDKAFFKSILKKSRSGTIIVINDLRVEDGNIYQIKTSISSYIGRVFRYFLPPKQRGEKSATKSKVNIYIGSNMDNCEAIHGLDPLELHLCPHPTDLILDQNIEVKDGDTKRSFSLKLSILGGMKEDEHIDWNFPPSMKYQGIYYVRENREIEGATLGHHLWGDKGKHTSLNRIRMEIRYSGMDDIFTLDHTKTHIEEIRQDVADKVKEMVKSYIIKSSKETKSTQSKGVQAQCKKVGEVAAAVIRDRLNTLELPPAEKFTRNKKNEEESKKGAKKSTGEGRKHKGGNVKTIKKTSYCEFREGNFTTAGPLFQYGKENEKLVITWNSSHPYYSKFVIGNTENLGASDAINENLLLSLEYMAFAIASAFLIYLKDDHISDIEYDSSVDNIMESISRNLRSLAN